MNTTYKQETKEISRIIIWKNAIESLTMKRDSNRILNQKYIQRLWDYVFEETLYKHKIFKNANEEILDNWQIFCNNVYGNKLPDQLVVAYLCGPEPENDLEILTSLGVRIENIYAFESDKAMFKSAIKNIRNRFPTLKIFNGKIETFLIDSPIIFDIIYLDFTSPLFSNNSKPFVTINTIFDKQALSELGILITNSCFPDKTQENIEFLESYFLNQEFSEYNVFKNVGTEDRSDYVPSISENGYNLRTDIRKYIESNFWHEYSAFATHYAIEYAALVQPSFRVLKSPILQKRLFDITKDKIDDQFNEYLNQEDSYTERTEYPLYFFIDSLKELKNNLSKYWLTYLSQNEIGSTFNRETAIKLLYMFRGSVYEKIFDILSPTLKEEIPKIEGNIPDKRGGLFCDVPMIHLWLELAVNQLGYPYHINTKNHKRYHYISKKREMCIDIYTFDKCRALYDWLPLIEYYGEDLSNIERQMLSRICIDAIGKQSFNITDQLYFGSALVGINEKEWSRNFSFNERINIVDDNDFRHLFDIEEK